jgi:phosphomannomutase
MAWHGKSLGDLLRVFYAEFGEFHYGRVDLDVKAGQKEKAIAYFSDEKRKAVGKWQVTRRENMDGIKVYLGDFGWLLVRPSGTENLLRLYCETSDTKTTSSVLAAVKEIVNAL